MGCLAANTVWLGEKDRRVDEWKVMGEVWGTLRGGTKRVISLGESQASPLNSRGEGGVTKAV